MSYLQNDKKCVYCGTQVPLDSDVCERCHMEEMGWDYKDPYKDYQEKKKRVVSTNQVDIHNDTSMDLRDYS